MHLFSGAILIHSTCVVYREMQASGLEGPIPSSLSVSSNMRYLWVPAYNLWVIFIVRFIPFFFFFESSLLNRLLSFLLFSWGRAISDLSGESSAFPNLSNMKNMQKLWAISKVLIYILIRIIHRLIKIIFLMWFARYCRMLRSCNITGSIPEYISNMTSLQVL